MDQMWSCVHTYNVFSVLRMSADIERADTYT